MYLLLAQCEQVYLFWNLPKYIYIEISGGEERFFPLSSTLLHAGRRRRTKDWSIANWTNIAAAVHSTTLCCCCCYCCCCYHINLSLQCSPCLRTGYNNSGAEDYTSGIKQIKQKILHTIITETNRIPQTKNKRWDQRRTWQLLATFCNHVFICTSIIYFIKTPGIV